MSEPTEDTPAMEVVGVSRAFGDVVALDDVNLEIRRGEVLAVLGENGAGKTTLMRILAGLDQPSSGHVLRNGQPYRPSSPRDAVAGGISLVHQHFALVPTMTAAETILLFRADRHRRCSRAEAARQLEALASDVGLDVDVNTPVGRQSVGERQRLELLRALDAQPDVLLLDEPTAVLTDEEAASMLEIVRALANDLDQAVVLITHRLREVVAAADKVVVLRNGRVVSPVAEVGDRSPEGLAAEMVGNEVPTIDRQRTEPGDVALRVDELHAQRLSGVSLEVRSGEIVGVAGVDGNGQAELEGALAGLLRPSQGTVTLDGHDLASVGPRRRIDAGVAYLPSDRYAHGLVGPMRSDENLLLGRTPRFLRDAASKGVAVMQQWAVKGEPHQSAASLSGGNAQKLVAARELGADIRLVLACQPTRGLDPGAAYRLRQELVSAAEQGAAVLWISADLDELLETADRIVVAFGGRLSDSFLRPFDRAAIGLAMAGGVSA